MKLLLIDIDVGQDIENKMSMAIQDDVKIFIYDSKKIESSDNFILKYSEWYENLESPLLFSSIGWGFHGIRTKRTYRLFPNDSATNFRDVTAETTESFLKVLNKLSSHLEQGGRIDLFLCNMFKQPYKKLFLFLENETSINLAGSDDITGHSVVTIADWKLESENIHIDIIDVYFKKETPIENLIFHGDIDDDIDNDEAFKLHMRSINNNIMIHFWTDPEEVTEDEQGNRNQGNQYNTKATTTYSPNIDENWGEDYTAIETPNEPHGIGAIRYRHSTWSGVADDNERCVIGKYLYQDKDCIKAPNGWWMTNAHIKEEISGVVWEKNPLQIAAQAQLCPPGTTITISDEPLDISASMNAFAHGDDGGIVDVSQCNKHCEKGKYSTFKYDKIWKELKDNNMTKNFTNDQLSIVCKKCPVGKYSVPIDGRVASDVCTYNTNKNFLININTGWTNEYPFEKWEEDYNANIFEHSVDVDVEYTSSGSLTEFNEIIIINSKNIVMSKNNLGEPIISHDRFLYNGQKDNSGNALFSEPFQHHYNIDIDEYESLNNIVMENKRLPLPNHKMLMNNGKYDSNNCKRYALENDYTYYSTYIGNHDYYGSVGYCQFSNSLEGAEDRNDYNIYSVNDKSDINNNPTYCTFGRYLNPDYVLYGNNLEKITKCKECRDGHYTTAVESTGNPFQWGIGNTSGINHNTPDGHQITILNATHCIPCSQGRYHTWRSPEDLLLYKKNPLNEYQLIHLYSVNASEQAIWATSGLDLNRYYAKNITKDINLVLETATKVDGTYSIIALTSLIENGDIIKFTGSDEEHVVQSVELNEEFNTQTFTITGNIDILEQLNTSSHFFINFYNPDPKVYYSSLDSICLPIDSLSSDDPLSDKIGSGTYNYDDSIYIKNHSKFKTLESNNRVGLPSLPSSVLTRVNNKYQPYKPEEDISDFMINTEDYIPSGGWKYPHQRNIECIEVSKYISTKLERIGDGTNNLNNILIRMEEMEEGMSNINLYIQLKNSERLHNLYSSLNIGDKIYLRSKQINGEEISIDDIYAPGLLLGTVQSAPIGICQKLSDGQPDPISTHTVEIEPVIDYMNKYTTELNSAASAIAIRSSTGSLTRIILSNRGSGYTEAPEVIISGGGSTGGTGKFSFIQASAQAILDLHGRIDRIELIDPGSGYTEDPTVKIINPKYLRGLKTSDFHNSIYVMKYNHIDKNDLQKEYDTAFYNDTSNGQCKVHTTYKCKEGEGWYGSQIMDDGHCIPCKEGWVKARVSDGTNNNTWNAQSCTAITPDYTEEEIPSGWIREANTGENPSGSTSILIEKKNIENQISKSHSKYIFIYSGNDRTPYFNSSDRATVTLNGDKVNPIFTISNVNNIVTTYNEAPIIIIDKPTGLNGVRATATATLSTSGTLDSITLTDGGRGYEKVPNVVILCDKKQDSSMANFKNISDQITLNPFRNYKLEVITSNDEGRGGGSTSTNIFNIRKNQQLSASEIFDLLEIGEQQISVERSAFDYEENIKLLFKLVPNISYQNSENSAFRDLLHCYKNTTGTYDDISMTLIRVDNKNVPTMDEIQWNRNRETGNKQCPFVEGQIINCSIDIFEIRKEIEKDRFIYPMPQEIPTGENIQVYVSANQNNSLDNEIYVVDNDDTLNVSGIHKYDEDTELQIAYIKKGSLIRASTEVSGYTNGGSVISIDIKRQNNVTTVTLTSGTFTFVVGDYITVKNTNFFDDSYLITSVHGNTCTVYNPIKGEDVSKSGIIQEIPPVGLHTLTETTQITSTNLEQAGRTKDGIIQIYVDSENEISTFVSGGFGYKEGDILLFDFNGLTITVTIKLVDSSFMALGTIKSTDGIQNNVNGTKIIFNHNIPDLTKNGIGGKGMENMEIYFQTIEVPNMWIYTVSSKDCIIKRNEQEIKLNSTAVFKIIVEDRPLSENVIQNISVEVLGSNTGSDFEAGDIIEINKKFLNNSGPEIFRITVESITEFPPKLVVNNYLNNPKDSILENKWFYDGNNEIYASCLIPRDTWKNTNSKEIEFELEITSNISGTAYKNLTFTYELQIPKLNSQLDSKLIEFTTSSIKLNQNIFDEATVNILNGNTPNLINNPIINIIPQIENVTLKNVTGQHPIIENSTSSALYPTELNYPTKKKPSKITINHRITNESAKLTFEHLQTSIIPVSTEIINPNNTANLKIYFSDSRDVLIQDVHDKFNDFSSECNRGYWINADNVCKPCPAGTLLVENHCNECDRGQYSEISAAESCMDCPKGKYQEDTGKSECRDCVAGKWSNTLGADENTCENCDVSGRYSAAGASSCTPCDAGKYEESNVCQDCQPGQYSGTSASGCIPCATGTYQDEYGQSSCKLCPKGKYQNDPERDECKSCPKAKYNDNKGSDSSLDCKNCVNGKYTADISSESIEDCLVCGKGHYLNMLTNNTCQPCANVGTNDIEYYQDQPNQPTCKKKIKCGPGEYLKGSSSTSAGICAPCPYGSYSISESYTCINVCNNKNILGCCEVGKYRVGFSVSELGTCEDCPNGEYSSTTGARICNLNKICNAGYGNNGSRTTKGTECIACEPGKYNESLSSLNCKECESGQYQNQSGQVKCLPLKQCGYGYISINVSTIANNECKPCDAGQYKNDLSASGCDSCDQGFWSGIGFKDCTACEDGKYQNEIGKSSCKLCPLGKHTGTSSVKSNCAMCIHGKYKAHVGKGDCTACEIGRYQNGNGQATCIPCESGKYQNETNKVNCKECESGQYSQTGYEFCNTATAGRYKHITTLHFYDCNPGKYSLDGARDYCNPCPKGKYQNSSGSSSCISCAIGKYIIESTNESACEFCPRGKYSDGFGEQCIDFTNCDENYYVKIQGSITNNRICAPCEIGKYSSNENSLYCNKTCYIYDNDPMYILQYHSCTSSENLISVSGVDA